MQRLGRSTTTPLSSSPKALDDGQRLSRRDQPAGPALQVEDKRSRTAPSSHGAPCPPFQKLAVPDGSWLRLAQQGPEMQPTVETVAPRRRSRRQPRSRRRRRPARRHRQDHAAARDRSGPARGAGCPTAEPIARKARAARLRLCSPGAPPGRLGIAAACGGTSASAGREARSPRSSRRSRKPRTSGPRSSKVESPRWCRWSATTGCAARRPLADGAQLGRQGVHQGQSHSGWIRPGWIPTALHAVEPGNTTSSGASSPRRSSPNTTASKRYLGFQP